MFNILSMQVHHHANRNECWAHTSVASAWTYHEPLYVTVSLGCSLQLAQSSIPTFQILVCT